MSRSARYLPTSQLMISICLCSSSNVVSGLSEGVGSGDGVYQDVFLCLPDTTSHLFDMKYFNPPDTIIKIHNS